MSIYQNNDHLVLTLKDEQDSEQLGHCLAQCLSPALVITFSGELGTGKTTIIRAMLRQLGVQSRIKSPTFSLVESYHCPHFNVHHFDLYRIHHEDELDYIGFRDYFASDTVCCIEWPEQAKQALPRIDIWFKLENKGAGRVVAIGAESASGISVLACLAGKK